MGVMCQEQNEYYESVVSVVEELLFIGELDAETTPHEVALEAYQRSYRPVLEVTARFKAYTLYNLEQTAIEILSNIEPNL